jgi:glyoxylase-like metal-dependent hydrolase (beta-lactamase superfamily II)
MLRPFTLARVSLLLAAVALTAGLAPAQDLADVRIETVHAGEGVYMLSGRGGNIGLAVGPDGAFLVDDQYAPLTPRILAAVGALTDRPIRFVVNTHWHGDHTGGNENMGKAGALLVAHENVRRRMSVEQFSAAFQRKTPPSPEGALPVVTFTESVTFHWNGDEIRAFHVDPAHTDGDAIIHLVKADVIHMGDVFFNGMYPFIDTESGGRIDGMIAAADRVLALAGEKTRLIPGHGPLGTKADLKAYRDVLATARDRIAKLKAAGKTRDEVVAAKPTAEFDAKWGGGFMKPEVWTGIVYDSLK